ncbi:MAG: Peptidoglycan O-acetyltransferase [Anaerolineales bacterium]|nr:Peptidoglycan O-acetyltransferase [Anaerolineales bacterium]
MLFNSLPFYIFFPLVTLGYFLLPHRFRWLWLLAASAYFYMAFIPAYILILFATILVDYISGLAIEKAEGKRRRGFLILSLAANLGMLGFFKYFNFFNANAAALAHWLDWNYPIPFLNILLPIGLSFHTFQSMAYTIEVYRGNQKAERHIGILALYVLFYPQLVAGPIERPAHMLPQFHEEHKFEYNNFADGLRLMAWGFFKKLVIADRLAQLVDSVFTFPSSYAGPLLTLAALAFSYQIYCDFSGYSDIAIGAARVMGFRLMTNFDRPYSARTISEFWQRWHISLSAWFRDYVFFPLRRALLRGKMRLPGWLNQALPTLITMLLSGLWHGANWTFVIWGGLHGLYLIVELWTTRLRERLARALHLDSVPQLRAALQTFSVFLLVSFALIFFRAPSLAAALDYIQRIGLGWDASHVALWFAQLRVTLGQNHPIATVYPTISGAAILALTGLQILLLETVQFLQKEAPLERVLAGQTTLVRWSAYYFLAVNIILFGSFLPSSFIYFQF